MSLTKDQLNYVDAIRDDLKKGTSYTKTTIEKKAALFNITNKNLVKELTELAIIQIAKEIANCIKCPDTGLKPTTQEKYEKIVELYNHQVNLSMRTSESMLLQQYSTPAPISYVAGMYVLQHLPSDYKIFEPSAGNGLLTIAFNPKQVYVNEIDDVRIANLETQGFHSVTSINGTKYFQKESSIFNEKMFDGIITNPPFGTLPFTANYGENGDRFVINTLDHLMALRALDIMKDNGRAAIIIGGHTKWDDMGRVQAGKNRIFLNYLHRYYFVDEVLNIDGHKLYSRQGTSFDVRLILISGRKPKPEGAAPLNNLVNNPVVSSFEDLFSRVIINPETHKQNDRATDETIRIRVAKAKAQGLILKLKMQGLEGMDKGSEYKSVQIKLKQVIDQSIISLPGNSVFLDFAKVSKIDVEKIKELTGKDYTGYVHCVDQSGIIHALKHPNITIDDLLLIPYIVENYDVLTVGKKSGTLLYKKNDWRSLLLCRRNKNKT